MSSAEAATAPAAETPAAAEKPGIVQQLRANPMVPLIVGVALAATLVAAMFLWAIGPNYSTLYSGLSAADGGEIVARLEQMHVPYQLAANGSVILVPTTMVDKTRLKLASQGLPRSAGVGFEIMDKQDFGISQFAEHINYIRALQGELARSIETLEAVASARVHLAIPEPTVFVREQAQPSASVILELYRGRSLGEGQVSAITHLVSSAVTHLPVDNITVVDASGNLLSATGNGINGVEGNKLEYITRIERDYRQRIEAILAPVVGSDNIRARVAADIDFSVRERTEEIYTPNQGDAAVRSKQISTRRESGGAFIGGVPGALSNRPAADLPSPIVNPQAQGNNQNGNNAQGGTGQEMTGGTGLAQGPAPDVSGSASRTATINYEVNRVIRHIQEETAVVEQLSAAVVVDYRMQPGENGEMQPAPLSDERMQQIKSLVKQAIGFSAARGDSVSVVNVPFQAPSGPAVTGPSWWQNPQVIALARNVLQWLLIGIVTLLLWRKLIKPLLNQVPQLALPQVATADGPALPASDDAEDDTEAITEAEKQKRLARRKQHAELMDNTQDIARNDPKLVAMIVKSWMGNNGQNNESG